MRPNDELLQQLRLTLSSMGNSHLPRYKQLYEALRQQILDGLLLPGTSLLSSRVLAEQLGVSRNTALAAVEQLCAEGYALARPASGTYILATAPTNWQGPNLDMVMPISSGLSVRGRRMSSQAQISPMGGAFTLGVPDIKQFPYGLWQRYVARHTRNPQLDWLAYPQQGGHAGLRANIAAYLRVSRGIQCNAAQLLITHNTQHGLQLVANLLADSGDRVWLENPGYIGARCAFDAAGLKIINQPVDKEGLAPGAEQWQQPPRLIYTTPSHQYPLGTVMSAARRRHLLALAADHQTWILEDDYDSEFRYDGAPLSALYALSPNQVIYFGSFSKTLFPALRIAYIVLPENLLDAFQKTQARHYREPSYILQNALTDFMADGHVGAYISKMRREYRARRDALMELLNNGLEGVAQISGGDTGLHLLIQLPSHIDDRQLQAKLYQHGVIAPALSCYYDNSSGIQPNAPGLLLGFGNTDQADIAQAGKILVKIIQQAL